MVKLASSLALIASLLVAAVPAAAVEYTVTSCAELADVEDTLATGLIIDSGTFSCDEYTRFRVRNSMVLSSTGPSVEFSNFSLKVLPGVELTVEPDVVFTGVERQVKNGGVLSVGEGATTTFLGNADFNDNSIAIKQIGPISCGEGCITIGRGLSYIVKKGGAVHNKGVLTFQGDAAFRRNKAATDDSDEQGKAGAISNTGSGSILFQGKLTMEDNDAEGFFSGQGGAIYNRGDIVLDGESSFSTNIASEGGAIFQTNIGSMIFNGMAIFTGNVAYEMAGGAINNEGGVMDFNAGSLFQENGASGSGDGGTGGAIYNRSGGVVTLKGPTAFEGNGAYWGGAIYNVETGVWTADGTRAPATITFPDSAVFSGNNAEYCPDLHTGDDNNCPVV